MTLQGNKGVMNVEAALGDLSKLDPGNMLDQAFSKAKACRALG